MPNPIVAIVGRPNVGKSTLFNRLVGKRIAIVEDTPGITRDRLYANAEWIGREFLVIDTGGMMLDEKDALTVQVRTQVEIAMEEADVIILVVDVTEGITPTDMDVANILRRTQKPVLLAVNKVENQRQERDAVEFYSLGLGKEIYPISSIQGYGVAELLDEVVASFPEAGAAEGFPEDAIKIAIIGRPNVGKSSMLNAIVREERSIVSEIPGTTRDAIDTFFEHDGQPVVLIDTAGIRRAGKVQRSVEYYSVLRAVRAIERADVVLLLVDASEGMADGDKRVGGYAHEAGRASVIVINKWDLIKEQSVREFGKRIRDDAPFLRYAPIVFASAKEGRGIKEVLDTAILAAQSHAMRLPTGEINRIIHDAVDAHPLVQKGRQFKVYYATMPTVKPPTVVIFTNNPSMLHFSYKRYLENRLRDAYPYEGTPVRIFARKAESKGRE